MLKQKGKVKRLVERADKLSESRFRNHLPKTHITSGEAEIHFLQGIGTKQIVLKIFHKGTLKQRIGTTYQSQLDSVTSPLNDIAQKAKKESERLKKSIHELSKNPYMSSYPDPQLELETLIRNKNSLPFVSSIRPPKIIGEKKLADGRYAVAMEHVPGPTFDELLQASAGNYQKNKRGEFIQSFVKSNNIDLSQIKEKISIINSRINHLTRNWGAGGGIQFDFRLDSFRVEGVDSTGNLKLILVDMR